jgi:hypothetical protein
MTYQYVLVDIAEQTSRLNGGEFYRLTWVCMDDMTRWETDVQDNYRNYLKNGWRSIVHQQLWGVYEGLTRSTRSTNRNVGVITADSRPVCVIPINTQATAIEVVLLEQERLNELQRNTLFDQVFVAA